MKEIVNLRMSSYFSMEDSTLSVDDIIDYAVENGQSSVALTNKGNLFNMIDFYQKARKKGIKPIVGLDAYIENDMTDGKGKVSRILMLAKNETGYKNLMRIISKANTDNLISGKPAIKESWLKDGIKDIIALSGEDEDNLFFKGFEKRELLSKDETHALINQKADYIAQYKSFFPDGFFLEVVRTGREQEKNFVGMMLNLSGKTGIPLVATQSPKFKNPEDYKDNIVRSALGLSEYIEPKALKEEFGRGQYLMSSEELIETYKDLPSLLENANTISKMCNVKIETGHNYLPVFKTPHGETADEYLDKLSKEGLERKLKEYFPDEKVRKEKYKEYYDRMNYELSVIKNKNFSNYFLVVADFVNNARKEGVVIGVGRGSAVGSLITTLIGITDVDPIKHDLYFERFLNPERVSMPDIDIDIQASKRKQVLDYLTKTYNKDGKISVAQIGTFNNYKIKSALASTSKLLDMPYPVVNVLRNSLANYNRKNNIVDEDDENEIDENETLTFKELLKFDEELRDLEEGDNKVEKLIHYTDKIIGIPSNVSKHASGVVISHGDLSDFTPFVKTIQDGEEQISTQYDMKELENVGLVKFDLLGLKNLDFTNKIVNMINDRPEFSENKLDLKKISYEDPAVYDIFKTANTGAVFQFESEKTKKILIKVRADNFDDLVATNALVRPGPNNYIDDYARRKLYNEKIEYIHPLMEKVTNYTYGILIYQEQVMLAAKLIAGYSLGEAEILRKAMGKKNVQAMKAEKERFLKGAKETNNISAEIASKIFDDIEKFAGYGFNKAHSVAYSMISYQNAYLKKYYPIEFFTVLVQNVERKKMNKVIVDLYKNEFKLLPPKINECEIDFKLNDKKEFIYGLSSVKDLNEVVAKKILKCRDKDGKFKDIFDFCERLGREDLSQKVLLNLINAGALDDLIPVGENVIEKRSLVIANIDKLIDYSARNSRVKKEKGFILNDLFGADGLFKNANKPYSTNVSFIEKPELTIPIDENGFDVDYLMTEDEAVEKEASVLGVCLSIDPLEKYLKDLKGVEYNTKLLFLDDFETNNHLFCGILSNKKQLVTKKGKDFMIVTVLDGSTSKDIAIFDEKTMEKMSEFHPNDFIAFKKYTGKNGYNKIDTIYNIEETKNLLTKKLNIALTSDKINAVIDVLKKHKGDKEVVLFTPEPKTNTYARLALPMKVKISHELKKEITEILGNEKFLAFDYYKKFRYPTPKSKLKEQNNNSYANNQKNKLMKGIKSGWGR